MPIATKRSKRSREDTPAGRHVNSCGSPVSWPVDVWGKILSFLTVKRTFRITSSLSKSMSQSSSCFGEGSSLWEWIFLESAVSSKPQMEMDFIQRRVNSFDGEVKMKHSALSSIRLPKAGSKANDEAITEGGVTVIRSSDLGNFERVNWRAACLCLMTQSSKIRSSSRKYNFAEKDWGPLAPSHYFVLELFIGPGGGRSAFAFCGTYPAVMACLGKLLEDPGNFNLQTSYGQDAILSVYDFSGIREVLSSEGSTLVYDSDIEASSLSVSPRIAKNGKPLPSIWSQQPRKPLVACIDLLDHIRFRVCGVVNWTKISQKERQQRVADSQGAIRQQSPLASTMSGRNTTDDTTTGTLESVHCSSYPPSLEHLPRNIRGNLPPETALDLVLTPKSHYFPLDIPYEVRTELGFQRPVSVWHQGKEVQSDPKNQDDEEEEDEESGDNTDEDEVSQVSSCYSRYHGFPLEFFIECGDDIETGYSSAVQEKYGITPPWIGYLVDEPLLKKKILLAIELSERSQNPVRSVVSGWKKVEDPSTLQIVKSANDEQAEAGEGNSPMCGDIRSFLNIRELREAVNETKRPSENQNINGSTQDLLLNDWRNEVVFQDYHPPDGVSQSSSFSQSSSGSSGGSASSASEGRSCCEDFFLESGTPLPFYNHYMNSWDEGGCTTGFFHKWINLGEDFPDGMVDLDEFIRDGLGAS